MPHEMPPIAAIVAGLGRVFASGAADRVPVPNRAEIGVISLAPGAGLRPDRWTVR
jgi:hypothetical protein